jgi:hypothetical protein
MTDEQLQEIITEAVRQATEPLEQELQEARQALAAAKRRIERDQKNRAVQEYARHRFGRLQ